MRLLPWSYGARNTTRVPVRLAQSVAGSALVVLLVIAAAAFVRGLEKMLTTSSPQENVVLLGAGSEDSLERSEVPSAVASIAAASIGGVKERLGVHYVSPEIHMASLLALEQDDDAELLAMLRGVTPQAFLVHPEVRITEGTAPGTGELLVGRLVATKLGIPEERLAVGRSLWFDGRPWRISGRFEAPASVMEAEIWVDLYELQIASKRDSLSCLFLTLDDGEMADVEVFTKQRLDLELSAMTELEYYSTLNKFYAPVRAMVWTTALLVALAGFFGGLNTLYAAFASRIRELATLQALGFSRLALLVSMFQEAVVAAAAGSLVAALVAIFVLDGLAVRLSMGAFGLVVDAPVMATGLGAGVFLGVLGTLPPAWRCLRVPVVEALKTA